MYELVNVINSAVGFDDVLAAVGIDDTDPAPLFKGIDGLDVLYVRTVVAIAGAMRFGQHKVWDGQMRTKEEGSIESWVEWMQHIRQCFNGVIGRRRVIRHMFHVGNGVRGSLR